MEKQILEQYAALCREREDIRRRRQSLRDKIADMEHKGGMVTDTVTRGKRGKKPLGIVKIEGFPMEEYSAKKTRYQLLELRYQSLNVEIEEKLIEVEEFIASINDSRMRQIIRYRYVDRLTWKQVAARTYDTEDSARMALERFLNSP